VQVRPSTKQTSTAATFGGLLKFLWSQNQIQTGSNAQQLELFIRPPVYAQAPFISIGHLESPWNQSQDVPFRQSQRQSDLTTR
jgi:hypothetical protein